MPGAFRIEHDFGPFRVGDTVVYAPSDWEDGRYVIVDHADGTWRAHRCETRHGLRFLVSSEAVLFDPDRHTIVGAAFERRERL